MQYLEEQRIVHRDLALRNLLVAPHESDKYTVKVADFGLSRSVQQGFYQTDDPTLPVRWCAPEVLQDGIFTSKVERNKYEPEGCILLMIEITDSIAE